MYLFIYFHYRDAWQSRCNKKRLALSIYILTSASKVFENICQQQIVAIQVEVVEVPKIFRFEDIPNIFVILVFIVANIFKIQILIETYSTW